jgi:predicted nucleotidyltransferase
MNNVLMKYDLPWGTVEPDFLAVTGSRLYGYANESSDWDIRGVAIEPPEYLLDRKRFDQAIRDHDEDITVWGFKKFFHLISVESPNVYELLFVPKEKIFLCSPRMQYLLNRRSLFVSKQAIRPILGYADSELKGAFADPNNIRWKRAAHTIRLLHQAVELLQTGVISYPLSISELLLRIRQGAYNEATIRGIADMKKKAIDYWMVKDHIPEKKNMESIDSLYYEIVGPDITNFLKGRMNNASTF